MPALDDVRRALFLCDETTYGVDRSANGALYLPFPMTNRPIPKNGMMLEETNYAVDGNVQTESVPTQDGTGFDVEFDPFGYATASGAAGAVPTADVLDLLLANALGVALSANGGQSLTVGSTTSNFVLSGAVTGGLLADDIVPIAFAASPARTHWRSVLSIAAAPTYTIDPPNWPTAPATGDIMYGARRYGATRVLPTGGPSLSGVVNVAGNLQLALGLRCSKLSYSWTAGKKLKGRASFMGDSLQLGVTKASLPTISTFNAGSVVNLSSVYWNGTPFGTESGELDFGLRVSPVLSQDGLNGRSDIQVLGIDPVITLNPGYDTTVWDANFRAGTTGSLLLQFGRGLLGGGRVNTHAFFAPRCQVISVDPTSKDNQIRQPVKIRVLDAGDGTSRRFVYARA